MSLPRLLLEVAQTCDLKMAGVRAGMFVRDAKAKCPDLEIVPYNFEAYEQVRISVLHHGSNNDLFIV